MKRVTRLLFHNWPLKLAAVLLATMLYAGFVVSQSVQEFTSGVQIEPLNVPTTARLERQPARGDPDPLRRHR